MVGKEKKSNKKPEDLEALIAELTFDLQRTRADFENYQKRMDAEKNSAREAGRAGAILRLLPVIDNIERAICKVPDDVRDHPWAQGIISLTKNLDKALEGLGLSRIDAKPGTIFNPELHEAIQFDEDSEGEHEVIAEEMQSGYMLDGVPIRHAMVRVTRK